MRSVTAFVSGFIFSLGLAIGGMLEPARVVGFLDFFGTWDPTLAFVMIGALAVNTVAYRLTIRRMRPLFAERFALPERTSLDPKLLVGSALFGIGWSLSGYCPGPALTNLVTGTSVALLFAGAMAVGALLGQWPRERVRGP